MAGFEGAAELFFIRLLFSIRLLGSVDVGHDSFGAIPVIERNCMSIIRTIRLQQHHTSGGCKENMAEEQTHKEKLSQ